MTRRSWLVLGAIATTAVAGALGIASRNVLGGLERASVSERYVLRGDRAPSTSVVIVAIDDHTVASIGFRPPPSRRNQAAVIRRLERAGAAVVALDLTENDLTMPGDDKDLLAALEHAHPAVVAVDRFERSGRPDPLVGTVEFADTGVRPGNIRRDPRARGDWITFSPSIHTLDAFALVAAAAYERLGHIDLPRGALIDYPSTQPTFPRISFSDVRTGRLRPADVRGKVVVLGNTAASLQDIHGVPGGGALAGPEIQAASIATALQGFPLRVVSDASARWTTIGLAALVPLSLLAIAAVRPLEPLSSLLPPALGLPALLGWSAAAQLLFDSGTAVRFVPGVAALGVGTGLAWACSAYFERRSYRELRAAFAGGDKDVIERAGEAAAGTRDARVRRMIAGYDIDPDTGMQGGQGIVYKAEQEKLERIVALKLILHDRAQRERYRAAFLSEARNAARIEHPHIVPIYDYGEDRGELYLTMRYVEGVHLGDLQAGPDRVARLLDHIAGALDRAHEGGVIHHDVKPANILVGAEDPDHPYLTDFGIARKAGDARRGGGWEGSKSYVAPEQIEPGATVDGRADIYSLGAVMFHCLTGVKPFRGTTEEVLEAHRSAPRPLASKVDPTLPQTIDPILAKAMAIDPAKRYRTAGEFTAAALAVLDQPDDSGPREPATGRGPAPSGADGTTGPTETATPSG